MTPDITLPHGYTLAFHERIDSTNSEALRRAGRGEAHGLWVWALSQDAGRGRLGRRWESLEGNLFASLLVCPGCPAATATQLGFAGGLALYDAVAALAGTRAQPDLTLKWPNDLLCNGRKAGGILLESGNGTEAGIAVVMGFGLNIASHPQNTGFPATDIASHGIGATAADALMRLAQHCNNWLGVWDNGAGFEAIRNAWTARSLPVNAPLEVKLAEQRIKGVYRGIDEDGALLMLLEGGAEKRITTGDVFPL